MPFLSINDYHNACERQVEQDNADGVECVYLPNTVINEKPKYCLIGAEPSCSRGGVAGMRTLIGQGTTNFLTSHGDFILQMCAYEYLCGNSYGYILTDLSKGAMPTRQARIDRFARYAQWPPILEDELHFYGDPIRIAVGKDAEDFLAMNGIDVAVRVLHYSTQNGIRFRKYFNDHPENQHLTDNLYQRLKTFVEFTFEMIDYPEVLRANRLNALFPHNRKELNIDNRGMYLHYRDKFLGL